MRDAGKGGAHGGCDGGLRLHSFRLRFGFVGEVEPEPGAPSLRALDVDLLAVGLKDLDRKSVV